MNDEWCADTPRKTGIKIVKNNYNKNNISKKVEVKPKTVHTHCDYCNSEWH